MSEIVKTESEALPETVADSASSLAGQNRPALSSLVEMLLAAPSSQIEDAAKEYISKWSDPPAPVEILEVLDIGISGGLISGFVVKLLKLLLEATCKREGLSFEQVLKEFE